MDICNTYFGHLKSRQPQPNNLRKGRLKTHKLTNKECRGVPRHWWKTNISRCLFPDECGFSKLQLFILCRKRTPEKKRQKEYLACSPKMHPGCSPNTRQHLCRVAGGSESWLQQPVNILQSVTKLTSHDVWQQHHMEGMGKHKKERWPHHCGSSSWFHLQHLCIREVIQPTNQLKTNGFIIWEGSTPPPLMKELKVGGTMVL